MEKLLESAPSLLQLVGSTLDVLRGGGRGDPYCVLGGPRNMLCSSPRRIPIFPRVPETIFRGCLQRISGLSVTYFGKMIIKVLWEVFREVSHFWSSLHRRRGPRIIIFARQLKRVGVPATNPIPGEEE